MVIVEKKLATREEQEVEIETIILGIKRLKQPKRELNTAIIENKVRCINIIVIRKDIKISKKKESGMATDPTPTPTTKTTKTATKTLKNLKINTVTEN